MKYKLNFFYLLLAFAFTSSINFGCDSDSDTKVGEVIFWYNHETSQALQTDGAQTLTFYVDEKLAGVAETSVYANGQPSCGHPDFISVAMDLEGRSARSFSYKIIGDNEFEYWSGTIEFINNTCKAFELTW